MKARSRKGATQAPPSSRALVTRCGMSASGGALAVVAAAGSVAAVGAQRLRKRRRARQVVGADDGTDEAVTERGRQRWVRVHGCM